ncbi:N-acetyltransferase ESCO2 [Vanrija pseudolonga]|uniref:N-acetyltransferase ESCO2 n=1 Tax=Vanrija pseudolonga TaxID=143232 RepID=A0AAF0Y6G7_9TREE|nr:N-acetyltransferase ESCO2 [Vanrija pseudolonga]
METRPPRRTYGKRNTAPAAPSSFDSPPKAGPGPSSLLPRTPPPSSPLGARASSSRKRVRDSSPSPNTLSMPPSPPPSSPTRTAPLARLDTNRQSTLLGFFGPVPKKRRDAASAAAPSAPAPTKLTQLHFAAGLRTCTDCAMSYVRGGDDEAVHARHHARVTAGIPWDGRGRSKVVRDRVAFAGGTLRVIEVDASVAGVRVDDILATVDTVLSAPALPPAIRERCKLFLAVTASPAPVKQGAKRARPIAPPGKNRERVVGVVVAQPIKWAMRVLRDGEEGEGVVDSGGGVMCDPQRLPTPLGIHRLFTVPAFRGHGLAQLLLDAAAANTVYGCTFDPRAGEVAFSQPTESGRKTMGKWGGGAVRVFVDDESQL